MWYCCKEDKQINGVDKVQKKKKNPDIHSTSFMTNMKSLYNGERIVFSINGGSIRCP